VRGTNAVSSLVYNRHDAAVAQLRDLAERHTGDGAMRDQIFKVLERWFVLGKLAKR